VIVIKQRSASLSADRLGDATQRCIAASGRAVRLRLFRATRASSQTVRCGAVHAGNGWPSVASYRRGLGTFTP
jgi:hypothetical protein